MDAPVVIVTGAARGIGLACARRFAADGWRVVIADSSEADRTHALDEVRIAAGQGDAEKGREAVLFVACDVSDKLSVHNLMAETLSTYGRVDCLINNAGIARPGGILDLSEEAFDATLAVNLRGAFLVSKAVVAEFAKEIEARDDRSRLSRRPYAIINMSSINDRVAIPDYLAYTVSKGGLLQMTKAMAIELAPLGIRVNAIGPGSVRTAMLEGVVGDEAAMEKIHMRTPLGRIADPDEVAGVAAFLAGPDASYITGEVIYVDGGRMALNYTMPRQGAAPDEA